jgi:hypothetical protein
VAVRLADLGVEPMPPAEFRAFIGRERDKWSQGD